MANCSETFTSAAVVLAATAGAPLPAEVAAIYVGASVDNSPPQLLLATGVVWLASMIGALILYAVTRHVGEATMKTWGPRLGLSNKRRKRLESWMDARGPFVVAAGRLIPGTRTAVSIPAALGGMKLRTFILASGLGFLVASPVLVSIGAVVGGISDEAKNAISAVAVVIAVAVTGSIIISWNSGKLSENE